MMKVHTYLIITCMFLLMPWSNAPISFQEDKPQYSLQQPIRIRPDYVEFNWQQGANDIIDSVQVIGEWDWDILANEWDAVELEEWGLDVWVPEEEPPLDELIGEEKNKPATIKITFESVEQLQQAEIDIQELLDRKFPGSYFSVSAGEL